RARVDIDVGVELLEPDLQPALLQQHADRRTGQPLAQRADHPAGHEDVLGHRVTTPIVIICTPSPGLYYTMLGQPEDLDNSNLAGNRVRMKWRSRSGDLPASSPRRDPPNPRAGMAGWALASNHGAVFDASDPIESPPLPGLFGG